MFKNIFQNILEKKIKAILSLLVFLVPLFWLPFTFEFLEFNKIYLLFFLSTVGVILWFYKMIFKDKEIRIYRSPMNLFVLLFLVAMVLSAFFSKDKVVSLYGYYGRFWPSLVGIISLVEFYFLMTNNVILREEENPNKVKLSSLLKIFFASSFLVVIISYFSLLILWNVIPQNITQKIVQTLNGIVLNPVSGSYFGLSAFLSIVLVLTVTTLAFIKKKIHLFALGLLAFLDFGLLFIINFNFAYLAVFLSLLLFLIISIKKRLFGAEVNKLSPTVILTMLCALLFFLNFQGKNLLYNELWKRNFTVPQEFLLDQKTNFDIVLRGINENPLFGSGLGNFLYSFSRFKPKSYLQTNYWNIRFDRGASHILELISTTGIIGGFSYLLLILAILSFSLRKNQTDETKNYLKLSLGLAIVATLVLQFFYYQNTVLAFTFWFLLSALEVIKEDRKEKVISFKEMPEFGLVVSSIYWVFIFIILIFSYTLGKLYLADLNYAKALKNLDANIKRLEKAAQLGDQRATYHLALSQYYYQKILQEVQKPENEINQQNLTLYTQSAIDEGKIATQREPNNLLTWENLGIIYRDIQSLVKGADIWAQKAFEKEAELDPNNPLIIVELGKIKIVQNDKEGAKATFERALSVKENYPPALFQLALLDEADNNVGAAKEKLQKIVEVNPSDVEAHFNLGRIYYNEKDYDRAIQEFQAGLIYFPNHSNSLYLLGLSYFRKGDKDNALRALERVKQLNPDNQEVKARIEEIKGAASTPTSTEATSTEKSK